MSPESRTLVVLERINSGLAGVVLVGAAAVVVVAAVVAEVVVVVDVQPASKIRTRMMEIREAATRDSSDSILFPNKSIVVFIFLLQIR